MCTHGFLPCIRSPTCLTPHTKTLIDNIFYNGISNNIQSGNIPTNISDHLSQILFLPSKKNNNTNSNIYQCNFKNTDLACFQDYLRWIDWNTCRGRNNGRPSNMTGKFYILSVQNSLLLYK